MGLICAAFDGFDWCVIGWVSWLICDLWLLWFDFDDVLLWIVIVLCCLILDGVDGGFFGV